MFLGGIVGVLLKQRRSDDLHVVFQIISEDDGHWSENSGTSSSFWFSDYINTITAAMEWCENNCDPDIYNGIQYGWKFKE